MEGQLGGAGVSTACVHHLSYDFLHLGRPRLDIIPDHVIAMLQRPYPESLVESPFFALATWVRVWLVDTRKVYFHKMMEPNLLEAA